VVFGYELLARAGALNRFSHQSTELASSETIESALGCFGLRKLVANSLAFVNVTAKVLQSRLVRQLPAEQVVLEVLESVSPEREVIDACAALKEAGYRIALDDYSTRRGLERLLPLSDIVKVDFQATPARERARLADQLGRLGILLVAEKVETMAAYRQAVDLGYALIQGFFLSSPEMFSAELAEPATQATAMAAADPAP
jgi:EAL and modified HD-GYP domain-containing signal transduction protein